jgi:hypothetical protein
MTGQFAKKTTVAPEKTKLEIEQTLRRYGATAFNSGWDPGKAWVMFKAKDREVRFTVDLPKPTLSKPAFEQEERRRWRCLLIVIKAKLEAVASGIVEFDSEFMAQIVLPDGQTVGEMMKPHIALAYTTKQMPRLLPPPETPQ